MDKLITETYRPSAEQRQLSMFSKDIILSLLYFDIFKHPLILTDLANHSKSEISEVDLNTELRKLKEAHFIESYEGYFFLTTQENLVERRELGKQKAGEYLHKARKISKFISYFPFVRGVFLSGSISKGYADKDSDIDYFIVTEPGRLWLSRTLLILFKKTVLLNSRKYFCLNYFIDSEHLEIPDKNLFTAIELNYLLPTYNEEVYTRLVESNHWSKQYLPNFKKGIQQIIPAKNIFIKTVLEKIFSGFVGEKLDDLCLVLTERFWKYKFRKTIRQDSVSIRCKKHVSKFHPRNFQDKILEQYETKISEYEKKYEISLRS